MTGVPPSKQPYLPPGPPNPVERGGMPDWAGFIIVPLAMFSAGLVAYVLLALW